ncbi:NADP-dependent oxidoreductase [Hymenobacter armeniacus]|uniref:NADP-dependent oxidoreductase n=1 Tax=Hymenobacter armeniacus TaxID=2771358 RepID=A0ABR8JT96_9BACT|nr:NADP-dependent oxidoreductase [Hymenobacter armeniacus]MBD2721169.1 NADP-dependent oxidoreductase [Hymenobacter armeniacus]
MKAYVLTRYGSNKEIQAVDLPEPLVKPNDVLIQIKATSVNPVDFKIRDGQLRLALPLRFPHILGNDAAGVVAKVGSSVTQFSPGDEVYARVDIDRMGAFAEYVAVDAGAVAPKPARSSMEEAAALPLVALTAWQALREVGQLQPGQRVLIHAGSGGVGTMAIQLAKHWGAHVATTTSTPNVEWVQGLGADQVIDYKKQAFETVLNGFDLVLDTLGGDALNKSFRVLKPGGKVVSVAGPPDPQFAKDQGMNWFMQQALGLLSFRVRRLAKQHHASYSFLLMHPSGPELRVLSALVDAGTVRPVIDQVFPFEATKEAIAYLETGRAKGKVVIRVA